VGNLSLVTKLESLHQMKVILEAFYNEISTCNFFLLIKKLKDPTSNAGMKHFSRAWLCFSVFTYFFENGWVNIDTF